MAPHSSLVSCFFHKWIPATFFDGTNAVRGQTLHSQRWAFTGDKTILMTSFQQQQQNSTVKHNKQKRLFGSKTTERSINQTSVTHTDLFFSRIPTTRLSSFLACLWSKPQRESRWQVLYRKPGGQNNNRNHVAFDQGLDEIPDAIWNRHGTPKQIASGILILTATSLNSDGSSAAPCVLSKPAPLTSFVPLTIYFALTGESVRRARVPRPLKPKLGTAEHGHQNDDDVGLNVLGYWADQSK